jgi:gamma-glutamylcyclotransferase (GGCT)/AIG2-like uncharacterized protein YtfP
VKLFIYGSLLPEFEQHALIRPYLIGPSRPGRVRGRLVNAGAYPALLPGRLAPDGCVRGLWVEIGREGLIVADRYEEFYGIEERNDYERIWLSDADEPQVGGWAYVWTDARGLPFEDGDWWPDIRKG